jgi:hypothetical protein
MIPHIHNNFVYVDIRESIYGPAQTSKMVNNGLIIALGSFGHYPVPITVGLWQYHTRDIILFCLVADDIGVEYISKDDVDLLPASLQAYSYQISTHWTGSRY